MRAQLSLESRRSPEYPSQIPTHRCAVWGHIEDKKSPLLRPGRVGAFSNSVLSHIEVMRSLLLFRELDRNGWKENGAGRDDMEVRFRVSLSSPISLSTHLPIIH